MQHVLYWRIISHCDLTVNKSTSFLFKLRICFFRNLEMLAGSFCCRLLTTYQGNIPHHCAGSLMATISWLFAKFICRTQPGRVDLWQTFLSCLTFCSHALHGVTWALCESRHVISNLYISASSCSLWSITHKWSKSDYWNVYHEYW